MIAGDSNFFFDSKNHIIHSAYSCHISDRCNYHIGINYLFPLKFQLRQNSQGTLQVSSNETICVKNMNSYFCSFWPKCWFKMNGFLLIMLMKLHSSFMLVLYIWVLNKIINLFMLEQICLPLVSMDALYPPPLLPRRFCFRSFYYDRHTMMSILVN